LLITKAIVFAVIVAQFILPCLCECSTVVPN